VAVKRLKYQRLTEDLMGKFNQELAIPSLTYPLPLFDRLWL
jgi:hypothetical protein